MGGTGHQVKTVFLLVLLSAIFLALGYGLGGQQGMMMAFMMSMVMNVGSYWFSDKIVLKLHRAQEVDESHPLHRMIRELTQNENMPMPKVYIVPEYAPNAFATGRDPKHAAVAATTGLLEILDEREIRGVMAHELGHVQNRDILISTVVATLASAVMYIAHMAKWFTMASSSRQDENRPALNPMVMMLTVILAPIATSLVQFAISRAREYQADETGARIARDPEGLASALEKISNPPMIKQFQKGDKMADMQPALSHLYIVNHFSTESALSLFSTHPPVSERVRRLRALTQ